MRKAFDAVCARLELSAGREDQATELVALKIIELARAGDGNAETLAARARRVRDWERRVVGGGIRSRVYGGGNMSEILVNLIIQAIGSAIGGNAIGATLKNMNLGPLGNTIAGALGGAGGGSILSALIPALSGAGLDIGALAGQFVGGGVTGAIVTAIVGAIVNGMKNKA